MPFNIGAPELIIILVIALIIIGPGKLPDVGSALGRSIREFRKAATDVQEATKIDTTSSATPASTTSAREASPAATPAPPPAAPSSEPSTDPRS